jgi:serine protease Do
MKKVLPILISSLLSALLAVWIYRQFETPQKVVVHQTAAIPKYTNFNNEQAWVTPIESGLNYSASRSANYPSAAPTHFTTAAEAVTPAVVNIKAVESRKLDWWGGSGYGSSSGSGVLISPDGYVVTNNHVIEDGDEFEITLNDKREYIASLIGVDPSTDLALLKIEGRNFPYLAFGDSDSLKVGEWVLAVGNPFNLESTVTAGIVSAKGRNIDILDGEYSIESFIQTDAAVNPGNSGGALVNTVGQLVGINTAIITRSGRYEGYSFAVPSNLVRKIITDLRDFGAVQRGILGIGIGEVSSRQASQLGLATAEGVFVTRVTPESGAADAGLKRGDVIIGINSVVIKSVPELQEMVARYRPGNSLKVEYIRNGKKQIATVVLQTRATAANLVTAGSSLQIISDLGFELRNLSREEVRRVGKDGIYVVSIFQNSVIEKTQMDPGYIITHINGKRVYSMEELADELTRESGEIMLEGIYEEYKDEYYYIFEK